MYIKWAKSFRSSCLIPGRLKVFYFSKTTGLALGNPLPPSRHLPKLIDQCAVAGVLCLGLKRPGREVEHLTHSSVQFENAWN